ncbi:MAG: hypothetical protein A3B25_00780 [Candidatus Ryanbacteria bacterium RIFCSPLOWO2_01_FULL_48_26]|uniref:Uncharacterized protein n=1 Tax=Candidatus Ryanbacteria bacterium RIFCSPLOWO2_01_FULL_48_26 TaxID=1802126 RepID=A0A1G2GS76_9BACT|nr:MAG: hypothetical protein A3B25_00780 [Candidatus Ryanbacteria bacterium RIFCSPLOWO2_01_FULL_48_26]OHB21018.1 MAG: hypothetical protein A3J67_05215 [Parcubacteria group bacterium RIFCSPHIGHO2_02_FULL_48_10b]
MNKITKGTKEIKFLYVWIVALLIIALFLAFAVFSPASPFRTPSPRATLNPEQLQELLGAPVVKNPPEVSKDMLNSLEGKNEPAAPTQDMMNMLSAPAPEN